MTKTLTPEEVQENNDEYVVQALEEINTRLLKGEIRFSVYPGLYEKVRESLEASRWDVTPVNCDINRSIWDFCVSPKKQS